MRTTVQSATIKCPTCATPLRLSRPDFPLVAMPSGLHLTTDIRAYHQGDEPLDPERRKNDPLAPRSPTCGAVIRIQRGKITSLGRHDKRILRAPAIRIAPEVRDAATLERIAARPPGPTTTRPEGPIEDEDEEETPPPASTVETTPPDATPAAEPQSESKPPGQTSPDPDAKDQPTGEKDTEPTADGTDFTSDASKPLFSRGPPIAEVDVSASSEDSEESQESSTKAEETPPKKGKTAGKKGKSFKGAKRT